MKNFFAAENFAPNFALNLALFELRLGKRRTGAKKGRSFRPAPRPCKYPYAVWTFSAWSPLGPLATLNRTDWPSWRLRKPSFWMAE